MVMEATKLDMADNPLSYPQNQTEKTSEREGNEQWQTPTSKQRRHSKFLSLPKGLILIRNL